MNTDHLKDLTLEELQKLKLKEEIRSLKRPVWKQTQFISIVVTLIVAFTGTSITIWQSQKSKIDAAESERKRYEDMTKELEAEKNVLKERTAEANLRYYTAESQMGEVVAQKTEVSNKINSLQEINLIQRENDLKKEIAKLQHVSKELQIESNGSISGFVKSYVIDNPTVQRDINRFSREGMKQETEDWLIKQFLFTAIRRYHKYMNDRAIVFFGDGK